MDSDLFLVTGLVLCALSLPSIVGAISDGRAPRVASIAIMVGGVLVVLALRDHSYTLGDVPDVFVRVIGRYL